MNSAGAGFEDDPRRVSLADIKGDAFA